MDFPLTQSKYASLLVNLRTNGAVSNLDIIQPSQTRGSLTYEKITFGWVYSTATETITIIMLSSKNWRTKFVKPETVLGMVNTKLLMTL